MVFEHGKVVMAPAQVTGPTRSYDITGNGTLSEFGSAASSFSGPAALTCDPGQEVIIASSFSDSNCELYALSRNGDISAPETLDSVGAHYNVIFVRSD